MLLSVLYIAFALVGLVQGAFGAFDAPSCWSQCAQKHGCKASDVSCICRESKDNQFLSKSITCSRTECSSVNLSVLIVVPLKAVCFAMGKNIPSSEFDRAMQAATGKISAPPSPTPPPSPPPPPPPPTPTPPATFPAPNRKTSSAILQSTTVIRDKTETTFLIATSWIVPDETSTADEAGPTTTTDAQPTTTSALLVETDTAALTPTPGAATTSKQQSSSGGNGGGGGPFDKPNSSSTVGVSWLLASLGFLLALF